MARCDAHQQLSTVTVYHVVQPQPSGRRYEGLCVEKPLNPMKRRRREYVGVVSSGWWWWWWWWMKSG